MNIYLDNNATTMIDARVLDNMKRYLSDVYGNSSSHHEIGLQAGTLLNESREKIAHLINCDADEIIFTGSGTESDNMGVRGYMNKFKPGEAHIIVSAIEHPAVLNNAKQLIKEGYAVDFAPVGIDSIIDMDKLKVLIKENTKLISVMTANNETGSLQPVKKIAEFAKEKGIVFHTDAVQTMGKLPVDVKEIGCDMLSASAHKFYGPKGVGFLYIRKNIRIMPVMFGGRHEYQLRPGTVNVPSIAGMADALEYDLKEYESNKLRILALRERLKNGLLSNIDTVKINTPEKSIYNTLNVSLPGLEGESMLLELNSRGVYVSTGSACSSDSLQASHVMMAMGNDHLHAHGSLRLSLGKYNTEEEIDCAVKIITESVNRIREISPYK